MFQVLMQVQQVVLEYKKVLLLGGGKNLFAET
jgi:hypothetical protein